MCTACFCFLSELRDLTEVSATYSICTCGTAYAQVKASAEAELDRSMLLKKLHPSQVFTCLRLLGCSRDEDLRSHLMQVRTGEGKSIVLGMLATVLGLSGKKVSVVCYSQFLSDRDQKDFAPLFELFQLQDRIKYDIIESYVENRVKDMRPCTEALLSGEPDTTAGHEAGTAGLEEVLLVDEADILLSESYLGGTFNQVAEVGAAGLLRKIWDLGESVPKDQLVEEARKSQEYDALKQQLGGQWEFLIDFETQRILVQLEEFRSSAHARRFHFDEVDKRIGYFQHDTVNYDVSFGYHTVFAYLQLADEGKLADDTLEAVLNLQIPCARYSYADILLPKVILGVSGTVPEPHSGKRAVLQQVLGIDDEGQYSCMPSVFGESNLRFLDSAAVGSPLLVCDVHDYFLEIAKDINQKLRDGRAVLVFFADRARLEAFAASEHCGNVVSKPDVLSELNSPEERTRIVLRAATHGRVTLSTAAFGRGTDFISVDTQLLENGGLHVIQSFFSMDKSEEIQIQGRTARQGQPGSYSMILSAQDLESQGLKDVPKGSPTEKYQVLEKFREQSGHKWKANVDDKLVQAQRLQTKTEDFARAVETGNADEVRTAFRRFYNFAQGGSSQEKRCLRSTGEGVI